MTSFLLLIIFFSSLSTVLEYIASSSGGYIGHIIFNYSSSYIGSYGVLVASLLTLLYSYVYYFDISVSSVTRNTIKVVTYLYLKAKYKLGTLYDKANLRINLLKQRNVDSGSIAKKKPNDTKVDIVKLKPQVSKRAFKEKQQTLFSDTNSKLPLLEFLDKHDSEIVNHDESSLKLMSEMLEQNLGHYGITAKVKAVRLSLIHI